MILVDAIYGVRVKNTNNENWGEFGEHINQTNDRINGWFNKYIKKSEAPTSPAAFFAEITVDFLVGDSIHGTRKGGAEVLMECSDDSLNNISFSSASSEVVMVFDRFDTCSQQIVTVSPAALGGCEFRYTFKDPRRLSRYGKCKDRIIFTTRQYNSVESLRDNLKEEIALVIKGYVNAVMISLSSIKYKLSIIRRNPRVDAAYADVLKYNSHYLNDLSSYYKSTRKSESHQFVASRMMARHDIYYKKLTKPKMVNGKICTGMLEQISKHDHSIEEPVPLQALAGFFYNHSLLIVSPSISILYFDNVDHKKCVSYHRAPKGIDGLSNVRNVLLEMSTDIFEISSLDIDVS